jgi:hypothetical protein
MSTPLRIRPDSMTSLARRGEPVPFFGDIQLKLAIRSPWTGACGVLVLLVVIALAGFVLQRRPVGTAIGPYQVQLDSGWLTYYQQNRTWLGLPIWGAHPYQGRSTCVGFENAIVCRLQDSHSGSEDLLEGYDLLDLGRQTLPKGIAPQVTAPAPVAQAYLDHLSEVGVNWRYWFGGASAISGVFCISEGGDDQGACLQYWPNQRLWWPRGSQDPNEVHTTQLGWELPRP